MNRFVAFDVETPNYANDRMSAIGIAVIENGVLTDSFYSLVNPETHFDSFNIALTKITPYMAAQAPAFPDLWDRLRGFFDDGILVAHNAPFDMSVLGKCLRDYGIRWKQLQEYVCTCQIGRRVLPQLPSHRLDALADYYSIPLEHHNAKSDTLACAGLLRNYMKAGTDVKDFLRIFDFTQLKTVRDSEWVPG